MIGVRQSIGAFLSPLAFALGFLMPLIAQTMLATELLTEAWMAYATGFTIAITLGAIAQIRGSWIWLK